MRRWSPATRGFGLVEVLVALAVLAVNVVGWTAAVHLILTLLRRIGEAANGADPAAVASAACGLVCLVPRARGADEATAQPTVGRHVTRAGQRGITLVELLVALSLGAVLLGGVAATVGVVARVTRTATSVADAATIRAALPALIRDVVEASGRGMPTDCGIVTTGTSQLGVRHALADGRVVEDQLFAGLDGGGRPALYLRRVPHARQPWVEDVTGFAIDRLEFGAGTEVPLRAELIVLAVNHPAVDEWLAIDVALPHRPCVEASP